MAGGKTINLSFAAAQVQWFGSILPPPRETKEPQILIPYCSSYPDIDFVYVDEDKLVLVQVTVMSKPFASSEGHLPKLIYHAPNDYNTLKYRGKTLKELDMNLLQLWANWAQLSNVSQVPRHAHTYSSAGNAADLSVLNKSNIFYLIITPRSITDVAIESLDSVPDCKEIMVASLVEDSFARLLPRAITELLKTSYTSDVDVPFYMKDRSNKRVS